MTPSVSLGDSPVLGPEETTMYSRPDCVLTIPVLGQGNAFFHASASDCLGCVIAFNVTKNMRSELGGMRPPAPCAPYPILEGMKNMAWSPGTSCWRPSVHPGITW